MTELKALEYLFLTKINQELIHDPDFYKKNERFDDALFFLLHGDKDDTHEEYITNTLFTVFTSRTFQNIAYSLWRTYLMKTDKTEKNNMIIGNKKTSYGFR